MIRLSDIEIKAILEAYKNMIVTDPRAEEVSERRMKICDECPHKGINVLHHIKCSKCGCPLAAKTRSLRSKCPDGRWPAEV